MSGPERDRPVAEVETSLDDGLNDVLKDVDGPGISFGGGTGGFKSSFSSHSFDSVGSESDSSKKPEFRELRMFGGGFHRISSSGGGEGSCSERDRGDSSSCRKSGSNSSLGLSTSGNASLRSISLNLGSPCGGTGGTWIVVLDLSVELDDVPLLFR